MSESSHVAAILVLLLALLERPLLEGAEIGVGSIFCINGLFSVYYVFHMEQFALCSRILCFTGNKVFGGGLPNVDACGGGAICSSWNKANECPSRIFFESFEVFLKGRILFLSKIPTFLLNNVPHGMKSG